MIFVPVQNSLNRIGQPLTEYKITIPQLHKSSLVSYTIVIFFNLGFSSITIEMFEFTVANNIQLFPSMPFLLQLYLFDKCVEGSQEIAVDPPRDFIISDTLLFYHLVYPHMAIMERY